MKLLLFDIDGTLLLTHGVGRRSVEAALEQVLGRPMSTEGVSFSGKTDPQIFAEVLARHGLAPADLGGRFDEVLAAYTGLMRSAIETKGVEVLRGVPELLRSLAPRPDLQLALLTGNLEPIAYWKLEAAGLAHHFPFGAFGSDSPDRNALPGIALARARTHTGRHFEGRDVVVIGDTERDIACGRVVGAFAVAVCTGHFTRDDLAPHEPDVLLDDLSDASAFLSHVLPGEP